MGDRWSRIARAYHRGDELPAVSLYKIGNAYFVRDGNHRVSVARYHGVAAIDAEVVEIRDRWRGGRYGQSGANSSSSCGILTGLPVARSTQAWRVWPLTSTSAFRSTS